MASFPNSVKSFTTKNTGDVVQAAHINDLQDEVAAIESGYLNGTARLNAAGSTLTSLSVTGNSTLAAIQGGASTLASLHVTGASTFAGARPVFAPPDAVRVNIGSTLAVANAAAAVYINWIGTKDFEINSSIHSSAVNSSVLTPQSTGLWRCTAQVTFSTQTNGYRSVTIADSSGAMFGLVNVAAPVTAGSVGGEAPSVQVSAIKYFDVLGGSVKVGVFQTNGSTLSVTAAWVELVKL